MDIGIVSFAATSAAVGDEPPIGDADRMAYLLDEIEAADRAGLDVFGIGEHHRDAYLDSAPAVILAAAAARTKKIRLTSAVTVLSAADPVRVFQEFATLDLIARGRAEIVVGRGSSVEAYPLFGHDLADYDALFAEKLDLLLALRERTEVEWSGRFRAPLRGQGVYPRPQQAVLPVWLGVGGSPESFVRAGTLGLPLMIAVIGGDIARFRPLVDLYRRAGAAAGHAADALKVGVHTFGFVADTDDEAHAAFFPGWQYMFTKIGAQRGWPPATRAQYDQMTSPHGAFLVGSPDTVIAKIRQADLDLAGIARITVLMNSAARDQPALLRSTALLGGVVRPAVQRAPGAQPLFFKLNQEIIVFIQFSKDHYWVRTLHPLDAHPDSTAVVGVAPQALEGLGDLIAVTLPNIGETFAQGAAAAVVESTKTASDLYIPVAGEIVEVNESLRSAPTLANTDPLNAGWFFKVKLSDPGQLDALLDEAAYAEFLRNL
jgi:glycine cleavage system H protein